jgi:CheY-like chemotaxis protein
LQLEAFGAIGPPIALIRGVNSKLKRILSVDDDPGIGALIQRVFEATGRYCVAIEQNALNAVESARLFRPDVLIVDVKMPGKTGVELAKQVRSEPWLRYRPIVLFTALAKPGNHLRLAFGDGPTEFLSKGVPVEEVLSTVDRLLAEAERTASSS